jgi:excisionase family DNA binding protein
MTMISCLLASNQVDAVSDPPRKTTTIPPTQPVEAEERSKPAGPGEQIEIFVNGVRVEVAPELEVAVLRAYKGMFQPLPREMTTTQAAEFLDVSRPFVIKLIKRCELPCRMVGKHRRIPTDALLGFREKMFRQAKVAADEMAQMSQELGLYEGSDEPPAKAQ